MTTAPSPTTAAYTTLQPEEVADIVEVDAVTQLRYSPGSNPFWRLGYYPNGVFPAVDDSVDFIDFEQFLDGIDRLQSNNTDRMRYYSVGESPGHYNLFLVANALADRGNSVFDSITRYGYYLLWGSYLDCLCPHTGASGMLYEVFYQSDTRGQMALGRMMQATKVGFLESFEALATGSLSDADENDYFRPLSTASI